MMSSLRVCYQTVAFDEIDIHVRTLRDKQQYFDPKGIAQSLGISSAEWPLFGVIWPSSKVLAHLMFNYNINGKQILEVGCGIALPSLVLNHRQANITATDLHPEVESFLQENTKLNQDSEIPFIRMGWEEKNQSLGLFDLIIGSDLLYEHGKIAPLAQFIEEHSKPHCEIILVDPGRGHHAKFSKKMERLDYTHSQSKPENIAFLTPPFKGQVLRYRR